MKLGRDTGSLDNHLMAGGGGFAKPGMGATILMWTDRRAATVSRVSPSGKTLWLREDRSVRTDANGMSESQTYAYTPDPGAPEQVFRLTRRGWRGPRGGDGLCLGHRETYYDFSF